MFKVGLEDNSWRVRCEGMEERHSAWGWPTEGSLSRQERTTHPDEATMYMELAEQAFAKGGQAYDQAKIRAAAERLDKAWDDGPAAKQK